MKFVRILAALGVLIVAGLGTANAVDTTIYNIQTGAHAVDDEVSIHNVVVTATGFWGFFVQVPEADHHPAYGYQYSGIWVYTGNAHLGIVHRGDLVDVTGIYQEYYDLSEIDTYHSPCGSTADCGFTVVGTGTVPTPVTVDIADINLPTSPLAEAYEEVLVRVDDDDNTLYAGEADTHQEWYLRTDLAHAVGDSIMIDHFSADPNGDFDYTQPAKDQLLTFVQGPLQYDYSQFKIAPRSCPDDLGMPCAPELRAAWARDNTHVDVMFALPVDQTSAESEPNYSFESYLSVLSATRDAADHRLVHLETEPQEPGIIDIIYVEGVFSEGDMVEMAQASYTFTQGIISLEDIQYVTDVTVDASLYRDVVVTTTGRVAAVDGRYYFLQQGDAGPWKHLYSRVSAVGDLAVGDSVIVAGRVTEYYDHETELSYAAGVQRYENLGPATQPVITTDLLANQLIYDAFDGVDPDPNTPEPWEGAMVRLNQTCYIDSVNGEGIYGEWWLLPGTGTPPDTARTDFIHLLNDNGATLNFIPTVGDSIILSGLVRYEYGLYRVIPLDHSDIDQIAYGGSVDDIMPGMTSIALFPNRPNPFGSATTMSFHLEADAARVSVQVYDVTGACVRHLLKNQPMRAGDHGLRWDGMNDEGATCSSGVYFYRLDVDGRSQARRMMRLD